MLDRSRADPRESFPEADRVVIPRCGKLADLKLEIVIEPERAHVWVVFRVILWEGTYLCKE